MNLHWIGADEPLPQAQTALCHPNGLVAAGDDLSGRRLLEAYRKGIFPWFSQGQPVLWWSPDPRMVLKLTDFRITRSFAKTLRAIRREGRWTLRLNTAFDRVMRACAQPRPDQDGTWITESIRQAYGELHRAGFAHSIETWQDDELVGGLYGVSIGRMFYGESMFARQPNASKVALAGLVGLLEGHDFPMIDCQQNTAHLASMGAREIKRQAFLSHIEALTALAPPDWPTLPLEFPDA